VSQSCLKKVWRFLSTGRERRGGRGANRISAVILNVTEVIRASPRVLSHNLAKGHVSGEVPRGDTKYKSERDWPARPRAPRRGRARGCNGASQFQSDLKRDVSVRK